MILAFAEELCWKGDMKRSSGKEVVFRVTSIGKIQGSRVDFELRLSYDIWYDMDDDQLIQSLEEADPTIDWCFLIYHKRPDHSGITIYDPDSGSEIGSIVVRRAMGGDPRGEIDMTNVVSLEAWRQRDG